MQNRTEDQGSRRDCNQTLEGYDQETRCLMPSGLFSLTRLLRMRWFKFFW